MPTNPCLPSPCGPFSECRDLGGSPSCSCLPQYMGSPPNCRPECTINTDCSNELACINEKCVDPCPGSCGINANCRVQGHVSICTCFDGYAGDPFQSCSVIHNIGKKCLSIKQNIFRRTSFCKSNTNCPFYFQNLSSQTYAIHHLVGQMQFVMTEFARVCKNIMVIHISNAVPNVE